MRNFIIRIGNFFFRYRNVVFPLYIVFVFYIFKPPVYEIDGKNFYEDLKDVVAIAFVLAGLALRALVIGFAYIKRGGMNKKIYAESLVTEGIFAISRNPLYLGNMLLYSGVFLMFGHWLCLVIGVVSFGFIYYSIVLAEEKFLEEKFGEGYRAYCRDVPRWIPRLSKFREAIHGMYFDWRKVVAKDHGTICGSFIVLALIENWEILANYEFKQHKIYSLFLFSLVIGLGLVLLLVRKLKKSGYLQISHVHNLKLP